MESLSDNECTPYNEQSSKFLLPDSHIKDLGKVLLEKKSRSTSGKRFRTIDRSDKPDYRKRRLFDRNEMSIPIYKNYEILGDSQFVRFAEKILSLRKYISTTDDTNSKCIGYCVSGQKMEHLNYRLKLNKYDLHSNVIVMIGTNDIVNNSDLNSMYRSYDEIVETLEEKCEKIVLLTIPPVPKHRNCLLVWEKLKAINNFIKRKANNKKIFVVDLASVLIGYGNTINEDFFEQTFYFSDRVDLIHLNRNGFKILQLMLDIFYFNK